MSTFIKKDGLQLINGGYLSTKEEKPVTNEAFVAAQKRAHYVVTFAKHAKNKDFVGKKADSLEQMIADVNAELATSATEYVSKPKKVKQKLTEELAAEAKAFMNFQDESSKADKINDFLQEFNIINEFEEFGLFFNDGIVKLPKIYSVKEITDAVSQVIDLLK